MKLRKVLCPTDFSAGSQQALRVAARLANASHAELVLAHSWHVPESAFTRFTFPGDLIQTLREDAEHGLAAAMRDARSYGVERVTSTLVSGVAWHDMVEIANRDEAVDLIVIGTHGRTGLRRVLMGSVAEKVIRHAPCSVLAVRPDSEPRPFLHALCPTDFSVSASHAVDLASEIVPPDGAITLVHVIEIPVPFSGEMPVAGLERELDRQATEALQGSAARLESRTKAKVTRQCRLGYPGAQTLAVLDGDPTIDIVIMGSQGRTGIGRALLGSVAEKVTRHARCPVLVARRRTSSP